MPERILWLVDEYVMKCELPEGLVRCETTADYAGYVAASTNGCIRRRASVQFRWERSLETISLELSNISGQCHPSVLQWK